MDYNSKLVIIKRYTSLSLAYIDQGMLESNGVLSSVNNAQVGNMFPGLDMITLSVEEHDLGTALELVEGSSVDGK